VGAAARKVGSQYCRQYYQGSIERLDDSSSQTQSRDSRLPWLTRNLGNDGLADGTYKADYYSQSRLIFIDRQWYLLKADAMERTHRRGMSPSLWSTCHPCPTFSQKFGLARQKRCPPRQREGPCIHACVYRKFRAKRSLSKIAHLVLPAKRTLDQHGRLGCSEIRQQNLLHPKAGFVESTDWRGRIFL